MEKNHSDYLKKKLKESIEGLSKRLESYENVEATLSNETLLKTLLFVQTADRELEKGFVNDSCNEVEKTLVN